VFQNANVYSVKLRLAMYICFRNNKFVFQNTNMYNVKTSLSYVYLFFQITNLCFEKQICYVF